MNVDGFPFYASFAYNNYSEKIGDLTEKVANLFGNCLMTSYEIEHEKVILKRGRLYLSRNHIVDKYNFDAIKSIRLFTYARPEEIRFYFRNSSDAALAKLIF